MGSPQTATEIFFLIIYFWYFLSQLKKKKTPKFKLEEMTIEII